jgi:predicted ester cyclase
MTSKLDVVKDYHDMAYTDPPASAVEAAEKYLSDDFQGFDKDGNVTMNKQAFVGMNHLLYSAFKDFRGVVHDYLEQDDGVMVVFHFEGTHTGDFDLSSMGLGVIPATGKRVVTTESKTMFMVEGDKIVGTKPISGGFDSFLEALGVMPPAA